MSPCPSGWMRMDARASRGRRLRGGSGGRGCSCGAGGSTGRPARLSGSGDRHVLSGEALSPRRIPISGSGAILPQITESCLAAKEPAVEPDRLVIPRGGSGRDRAPKLEDFVMPVASRASVAPRVRRFEADGRYLPGTSREASPKKPRGPAIARPRHPQPIGVLPRPAIHAVEMELCDSLSSGAEMRIAQAWPVHADLISAMAVRRALRRLPAPQRPAPQHRARKGGAASAGLGQTCLVLPPTRGTDARPGGLGHRSNSCGVAGRQVVDGQAGCACWSLEELSKKSLTRHFAIRRLDDELLSPVTTRATGGRSVTGVMG